MSAYELLDIAIRIGNRIDVHWGVFITVHLAPLGAIVYVGHPLSFMEKAGGLILYTGFAIFDFVMMSTQFVLMENAIIEIAKFSGDRCCTDNALVSAVASKQEDGSIRRGHRFLLVTHVVMFLLVYASMIFDRKLKAAGYEA